MFDNGLKRCILLLLLSAAILISGACAGADNADIIAYFLFGLGVAQLL